MWRWGTLMLPLCAACSFDGSVPATSGASSGPSDADIFMVDADPNAADADTSSEVELLLGDPLGDGTPVAFLADHNNRVYVGPSQDGTRLTRITYSGNANIRIGMSFVKDTDHANSSLLPFNGIGFKGCTPNETCGPHNEDLRGLFTSGTIDGVEWLILGGASDGGSIDHIYMSTTTGGADQIMRYVDLSGSLGGSTEGLSAAKVINNRLYLGFADTGGARPYLIDLVETPMGLMGLDAISEGSEVFDLDADDMPGVGDDPAVAGNHAMIDFIGEFNGLVQIANDGGWVHSRGAQNPPPFNDDEARWGSSTPDNDEYGDKTSIASDLVGDILPADRAVPGMVQYKGRLYIARNTNDGPQLWSCDPNGSYCDADNWVLVAPNTSDDIELTQFNNIDNTSLTLLQATNSHLYVGFDNAAGGVSVYRTDASAPSTRADFLGTGGCTASVGCEGLGGSGFDRIENTRFLDSRTIDIGGGVMAIYAIAGDTVAPLNVYRIH